MTRPQALPRGALVVALIALMLSVMSVAPPADAADTLQTIQSSGSQSSGRWKVFNLNTNARTVDSLSIVGRWNGGADVNIFLRDANGDGIAWANGQNNPERLEYSGNRTPTSLAVLVRSGAATYTVTVSGTATAPAPGPAPAPIAGDYPGQPAPGTLYWGASIQGNDDPVARHERHVNGTPLGVRRTFYKWSQRTTSLVHHATNDARAGRIPWVSLTTPGWRQMGQGTYDAQIDQLLRALKNIDGPVWLSLHHEPEGGGGVNRSDDPAGPSGHLAMNRRVRQRMTALRVDNVALAPILMAWTWDPGSRRNVNAYWDSSVYDFVGVDIYAQSTSTMLRPLWYDVRRWAADRGVDIAVGEWSIVGNNSTAAGHMRDFYWDIARSANDGRGAQVTAAAYFDSDNSVSGRYAKLRNASLTTFRQLMTAGPSTYQGE